MANESLHISAKNAEKKTGVMLYILSVYVEWFKGVSA